MLVKTQRFNLSIGIAIIAVLTIAATANRLSSNDWFPRLHERDYLEPLLDLSGATSFRFWPAAHGFAKAISDGSYPPQFEELRIDIKFKHITTLRDDRRNAIKQTILHNPNTVPANITYNGREYAARLRLKGDLYPHWKGTNRWSFRIRLKNGDTIKHASQFSLQKPLVRQFPYDQIFHHWGRRTQNLEPNENYFRVYVNGSHWGIMLAEEHMSRHFLETNARKEAPIVRFGSEEGWFFKGTNRGLDKIPEVSFGHGQVKFYNDRRYLDDPRMTSLFSYVVTRYRGLIAGQNAPIAQTQKQTFLDIDLFSRVLIRAMIWNSSHTLADSNSRYYLNPYTLRLEPVSTDQAIYVPIPGDTPEKLKRAGFTYLNQLYMALVNTPEFTQRFKLNLDLVRTQLPALKNYHQKLCRLFPLDCPPFDLKLLQANADKVANYGLTWLNRFKPKPATARKRNSTATTVSSTDIPKGIIYPRHIHAELWDTGKLRVFNPLPQLVQIIKVQVQCRDNSNCKPQTFAGIEGEIQPGSDIATPNYKDFKLPINTLKKDQFLQITTQVGTTQKAHNVKLTLPSKAQNPLAQASVPEHLAFLHRNGNAVHIKSGTWRIDQPLILPPGISLSIAPGTTLVFAPNAYLIVQGTLIANGTEAQPIKLRPSKTTWKGIYVLETQQRSTLGHVTIEKTNFLNDGVLQLTGGVTFYKADVTMSDVQFLGSRAEDALNIVHSEFTIENSSFHTTNSDAFDSDFSTGILTDVHFQDIGGDGLDTSGSNVTAQDLSFEQVTDKAVSSGEQSRLSITSMRATNIGTGIVSKDGSITTVDGLEVTNSKFLAGMAYEKKNFYGPASLKVSKTSLPKSAFRCQTGHKLSVNGDTIIAEDVDVDALYSQGPMRKQP